MRIVNLAGRLSLVIDGKAVDVENASNGRFSANPQAVYDCWAAFRDWATTVQGVSGIEIVESQLGAPSPRPPQLFAIGLNYRDHAVEAKLTLPDKPMVFTKFPAAVTGPNCEIAMPPGFVDFETELVIVIGEKAENVSEANAWDYVAGLTAGQDLSERELQTSGPPPQQFSLGKSFTGFAPMGPALVTPDEFPNRDDIALGCSVNGVTMQDSRSREMIFSVPRIVSYLSSILALLPGDVIFTGTPAGVGWARNPRQKLQPGDELVTNIESIGQMRHRFVERSRR